MDEEKDGGIIRVQPPTVDFMSSLMSLSSRRRSLDDFQFTTTDVCVHECVCVCIFLRALPGCLADGANE